MIYFVLPFEVSLAYKAYNYKNADVIIFLEYCDIALYMFHLIHAIALRCHRLGYRLVS